MNTIQIEELLERLVQDVASGSCTLHDFPFRLMEAYEASRNEVAKLRMKHPAGLIASDIVWPKKMLYRPAAVGQVQATVNSLKASLIGKKGTAAKNAPRFVVSTDGDEFLAFDTKTTEGQGFDRLADLPVNYDYLLPMFGVEQYKPAAETTADVRAARHMAKFFDAILDANLGFGVDHMHDLNVFMTRILFCMFAEDTGIFEKKLFVETLRREAQNVDGTDTRRVIEDIFIALNIPKDGNRAGAGVRSRRIASDFEYVNGGLFKDRTIVPDFNRRARRLLLEAADLQWDQIHADIFGSMIQAVVHPDMRADFGMHYTSVPNIMKVLEPLFLSSLREQLTAAGDNVKAIERLIGRISNIHVFDPACGSGNFLIIAYRELRQIETEAFRRLRDVKRKGQLALPDYHTNIKISSFHGIDPVDFACETAKLSLWISQYQMNQKLGEICAKPAPALPLTDAGSIVVGNALRLPWEQVCPPQAEVEIFIVGNPPYLGRGQQNEEQKADMHAVFNGLLDKHRMLDFVTCWLVKASAFSRDTGSSFAFVTTNSIVQGEQVRLLWPLLFKDGLNIAFAYSSFKWRNSAAENAGVSCVIIGFTSTVPTTRHLYDTSHARQTRSISPYLTEGDNIIVQPERKSISGLPQIQLGNMSVDGGNLILSPEEKDQLIANYPEAEAIVRRLYGSQELIKGIERWCLWIDDDDLAYANSVPPVARRIAKTREMRETSVDPGAQALAERPHQFREMRHAKVQAIIIPRVSSETREYLPCGIVGPDAAMSDLAYALYDAPTWAFSIVSSKLHNIWARTIGGQLETRIRYSNTLVYNTFPLPRLSTQQKVELEDHALNILRAREPFVINGKNLSWLYDNKSIPRELLQAHRDLDDYLEAIYIGHPFENDAERLEHMFKVYARMTRTTAKTA